MVTPRFAPYTGGVEMHVAELSRRLAASGFRIEILTTDPAGALPIEEDHGPIRLRRFPTVPKGGDHYLSPRLAMALTRARYDIVHMQGVHSLLAPLTMLAARARRIPYIVTFHTGGHSSALRRRVRATQWRLLGPLLRGAAGLIAVSRFEQRLFADALGIPLRRIHLIPNGAELPAPFDTEEQPDLIVSVGRLEWYKGHHRAIAALPHLAQLRPKVQLLILGDGPIRPQLHQRAERLGVADRVTIRAVPPTDRGTLAKLVAGSSLVVLLSEYEAHPIAVAEALALGKRVLVADTTGLSEIIENGDAGGIDVDASPRDVASAIDAALRTPARPASRKLHTWEQCAAAVADIYRAVRP